MVERQVPARALDLASALALLALLALVLVAVGQPIFTDDLWWHLALGRAYASAGPWLPRDPLLFTASGPPAPAAWLSDLALAGVAGRFGLDGLRVLHGLLVVAILAGVGALLRRAGASRWGALLGVAVFAALSAYRLAQLRPHLATVLATLALYALVVQGPSPPSRGRMAAAVLGMALWANLHGGFLLGPALLLAAAAAWGLEATRARGSRARRARDEGLRLAVTAGLGLLASGLNPSGFDRHGALFLAGRDSPSLSVVLDEWSPLDPFAWPSPDLPPSPLTWLACWALVAGVLWAGLRLRRRAARDPEIGLVDDPAGLALGVLAFAAMLFAVRFTWLGVFPLLWIARASPWSRAGPGLRALSRVTALALLPTFVLAGAWPMLSRGIALGEGFLQRYRPAYPPGKYYASAVWFLEDSGLEGRLFNEYALGGFVGFWLAPELRAFVNGTLNLPPAALEAQQALGEGRGQRPGESFLELLDRYRVDVFFGVGAPALPRGARPVVYSTSLLEGTPGWLLVYRDQRSAVYLRDDERNRGNLERVRAYYERAHVPFDPERGFEPGRVLDAAPVWSIVNGLVPPGRRELQAATLAYDPGRRAAALDRLAQIDALLGLYQRALRADERLLAERPETLAARRRMVWSLLRLGRAEEALAASRSLGLGGLDGLLRRAAEALAADPRDEAVRTRIRRLPVLTHAEAALLARSTLEPELRLPDRSPPPAAAGRLGGTPQPACWSSRSMCASQFSASARESSKFRARWKQRMACWGC